MNTVLLKPFTREGLDVLFLALNPPEQSNANGHYFSGRGSRFFQLLFESGLITQNVPKSFADDIVFGSTTVNYKRSSFGVMDLVGDLVETQSGKVMPSRTHVDHVIASIRSLKPRFVCVIHSKVRDALNRHAGFASELKYDMCGAILPACHTRFVLNYFPNGNAVPDAPKLAIFGTLRDAL